MMTIAQILEKMIAASDGNVHDIQHLLKVWGYARTIGILEGLDNETQYALEAEAVVHDIACPLCREKYGRADGYLQEQESDALVRDFFADTDLPEDTIDRIAFVVSHHHTVTGVDGIDWQILLEADFLVNAAESNMSSEAIRRFTEDVAATNAGHRLLQSVYHI